jgi:3-polyprenyl-4-hydroxybenzoate decarboxylase
MKQSRLAKMQKIGLLKRLREDIRGKHAFYAGSAGAVASLAASTVFPYAVILVGPSAMTALGGAAAGMSHDVNRLDVAVKKKKRGEHAKKKH